MRVLRRLEKVVRIHLSPRKSTISVEVIVRRILFVTAGAVACAAGPARVIPAPSGGITVEQGAQLGWATKRVLTKQAPSTLIAQDGTVCRVSPDRFKDTQVGRDTACEWQLGNPR